MKRIKMVWISLFFMFLTACGNAFAERDYEADDKIAQTADHYAKEVSVFNPIDGGYSLTVGKFDGRETLWKKNLEDSRNIEIDLSLSLSKGQAKVVYIDSEDHVTTLLECTPETSTDGVVTQTVPLKEGKNRIKIVGYDCENLDLKMLFEEPE